MIKEKKEVSRLHKLQEQKLNEAIKITHQRPTTQESIREVIRLKKKVNELGIKLWEFSLDK